jgi:ankyrin repeat protein
MHHACTVACVAAAAPDLRTLAGWLAGQNGWTSLIWASQSGHVEAMRVLIEKGALIEAADKVRIHSQATTPHIRAHKPSYTPG